MLTAYENAALMIQTGLYAPGSDPAIDEAIRLWPKLDAFFTERAPEGWRRASRGWRRRWRINWKARFSDG